MSQEETKVASEKEVEEKVISIVSEQLGVDKAEISRETSFVNDLNADSLDTVELDHGARRCVRDEHSG